MPKKLLVLEVIQGLPLRVIDLVDTTKEVHEAIETEKATHLTMSRRYVSILVDPA
jgi:hypothetical protein